MKEIGIKKITKTSAVHKALNNLREYIRDTSETVLPNEDELSNLLGVSRLTVREAITILEREGTVSRIQGKGTSINTFITKLENRIDISSDIEGCLFKNGFDVRFEVKEFEYKSVKEYERERLKLKIGEKILLVKKVLLANDEVAAFYIDRIPEKLLKDKNITNEILTPSIFPTIERLTQSIITHDVVEFSPCGSDEEISKIFGIPINTPMIKFDVLEYTKDSIPLMYNTEYYTDKYIKFTLCRNVAYKI